jgi:hypothetical protein
VRFGYERGEASQEGERFEHEVGRAVVIAALELEGDVAVGREAQPFAGDRRAGALAQHLLEALPIACGDGDVGVQVEALVVRVVAVEFDPWSVGHAANLNDALAAGRAKCRAARDRCSVASCESGRLGEEIVIIAVAAAFTVVRRSSLSTRARTALTISPTSSVLGSHTVMNWSPCLSSSTNAPSRANKWKWGSSRGRY